MTISLVARGICKERNRISFFNGKCSFVRGIEARSKHGSLFLFLFFDDTDILKVFGPTRLIPWVAH